MEQYTVTGMSCAACAARVEKAVKAVPGVESCAVSLLTNSMGVEGTADPAAVVAAVTKAGYGASPKSDALGAGKTSPASRAQQSGGLLGVSSPLSQLVCDNWHPQAGGPASRPVEGCRPPEADALEMQNAKCRMQNDTVIADGRVPSLEEIAELDRQFIARNLSPGGCADLLAVTLFLESLSHETM
jgi:copper chaperone CopZ